MNRSQGSQAPIRALPTRPPQHGRSPRESPEDHRVWPSRQAGTQRPRGADPPKVTQRIAARAAGRGGSGARSWALRRRPRWAPHLRAVPASWASRPDGGPAGGSGRARRLARAPGLPGASALPHPTPRPSCRISSAWRRRFGRAAAQGGRGGRRRRFRTGCFRPATSPGLRAGALRAGALGAGAPAQAHSAQAHSEDAVTAARCRAALTPRCRPLRAAWSGRRAARAPARAVVLASRGSASPGGRCGGEAAAALPRGPPTRPAPPRPSLSPAAPAAQRSPAARHPSHARPRRRRRPAGRGCPPGRPPPGAPGAHAAGAAHRRGPDGPRCRPARRRRRPALEARGRWWSARRTRRRALGRRDAQGTRAAPRATPRSREDPPRPRRGRAPARGRERR